MVLVCPDLSVEGGLPTLVIIAVPGLEVPCSCGAGCLLSGGFGGGDREGVVGEVGDEVQAPAECLDVAGDGLDGRQLAALDLGDPARGDAHDLGELGLGKAALLALAGLPACPASEVTVPSMPRGRISPPSMVSSKLYRNRGML